MARKKIREYDAKRLFKTHVKRLAGLDLPINVVQVNTQTNSSDLLNANPWLASTKLVVKPDMVSTCSRDMLVRAGFQQSSLSVGKL